MKEFTIIYTEISSSPNYHGIRVIPLLIVVLCYQQVCAGSCSHSVCLAPSHFRFGLSLHLLLLSTWTTSYFSAAFVTLLQNSCSRVLMSLSTFVLFMHAQSVIVSALCGRFCLPFPPPRETIDERWLHHSHRRRELFDKRWLHRSCCRRETIDERIFKLSVFDPPWVWGGVNKHVIHVIHCI